MKKRIWKWLIPAITLCSACYFAVVVKNTDYIEGCHCFACTFLSHFLSYI